MNSNNIETLIKRSQNALIYLNDNKQDAIKYLVKDGVNPCDAFLVVEAAYILNTEWKD